MVNYHNLPVLNQKVSFWVQKNLLGSLPVHLCMKSPDYPVFHKPAPGVFEHGNRSYSGEYVVVHTMPYQSVRWCGTAGSGQTIPDPNVFYVFEPFLSNSNYQI